FAGDVLKSLNLKPVQLKSKEGLALLNGTQFMSAYGVWCILQTRKLSNAVDGRIDPLKPHIHAIRPHAGQIKTANNILTLLKHSEFIKRKKEQVQDPY